MFIVDDLNKANEKLREAEYTSDLVSEAENTKSKTRKRRAPRRLSYGSDNSSENEPLSKFNRPPKIQGKE